MSAAEMYRASLTESDIVEADARDVVVLADEIKRLTTDLDHWKRCAWNSTQNVERLTTERYAIQSARALEFIERERLREQLAQQCDMVVRLAAENARLLEENVTLMNPKPGAIVPLDGPPNSACTCTPPASGPGWATGGSVNPRCPVHWLQVITQNGSLNTVVSAAIENSAKCPQCGKPNLSIPRLGIFHRCEEK